MNRRIARWATLLLVQLALCGLPARAQTGAPEAREVQVAAAQFQRGAPLPAWADPFPALAASRQQAPLVVLQSDSQFSVADDTYLVRRAWQVNTASAVAELAQQTGIEFNPAYQKVRLHHVRVHRGGQVLDRLASARITFLQRERGLEQGVYSGDVFAAILLEDLRAGDWLDVAYSTEGSNPVLGGRYVEYASWDPEQPVELRRITLRAPTARKVAWKAVGEGARSVPAPVETSEGGVRKLRWEARALPRVSAEQNLPRDYLPYTFLQFSEFGSWAEVADWAHQLFQVAPAADAELAALVERLRARATPAERVAAALAWVQEEVRYFSLSLGESSHRPAQPAVTLARRYGDCKDKSLLLVYLLRTLGVQADPVLVSARTLKGADQQMPTPFAFDHAIVRVTLDGRDWYLDPTRDAQRSKLAAMGQLWQGARVLVVRPGNDRFDAIPASADLDRNELREQIRLPRFGGEGTIVVQRTWSGLPAELRRTFLTTQSANVVAKALLESYEERYPGARYAAPPQVDDDVDNNVLTARYELRVPELAVQSGGAWGIRFKGTNLGGLVSMPSSATRTQPYALGWPGKARYSVEIEFPPEVSKMLDPARRVVRDAGFEWVTDLSFRGNRATADIDLRVLQDRVEPGRTRDFMANIRRADEVPAAFVVEPGDLKSAASRSRTLGQNIAARLADTVDKLTRSIDGGKLADDDLAEALCGRSEALLGLGRSAEAMKDAQAAVRAAPNQSHAYSCRGGAFFASGDFARAVADYSKAITLEPGASGLYYERGRARFYAGQLAAAEQDFAKAGVDATAGEDSDSRLYAELWRVWTQKRLGATPSPAQLQLARQQQRGEWPRAALAMLHGLISPEDMLRSLDGKKGDDREMALAEAYFYAGQWSLLQGDKARAAEWFRKTREQGVTIYVEHASAGIELSLLAK